MLRWTIWLLLTVCIALSGCLPASGGGGRDDDAGSAISGGGGTDNIGGSDALLEGGVISLDPADGSVGAADASRSMDGALVIPDRGPAPDLDADRPPSADAALIADAGLGQRDGGLAVRDARIIRRPDAAVPEPLAACPRQGEVDQCAAACETVLTCALTDECPGLDPAQRAQYLASCQVACEANPEQIGAFCEAERCGPLLVAAEEIMPGFIDECLHGPPWDECMDLALCAFNCRRDQRCVEACANAGTGAARRLFDPLWTCIRPVGCVPESGLPDSDCVNRLCQNEWAECFAPQAPAEPGCIMALNCGGRCADLECIDDCLVDITPAGRAAFLAVNECAGRNGCQNIGCVVQRCEEEMRACHATDPGERGCAEIHTCFWSGANHPLSEYCPIHGRPQAQENFYRYLSCVQASECVGRAACDVACLELYSICWNDRLPRP